MFQKADIENKYREKNIENSLKTRNHFIEEYNQYLNNSLSTTLLKIKERFLNLKNGLVKELTNDLYQLIKEKINTNYDNYIKFLLETIKKNTYNLDKYKKITILFNSKDYNYFSKNLDKIQNLFNNSVEIKKNDTEIISGFKILLSGGRLNYDYSISNLIDKNSTYIEMEFSKIVSDSEIKEIEYKFENFIQNQKLVIKEYLKDYDRI